MSSTPLFCKGDLRGTLENARAKMLAAIDSCAAGTILGTSEETLADQMAAAHRAQPLVLGSQDEITLEVVPTKVDARGLPDRFVWDEARPVPVDGILVRLRIPFTGDPVLFQLQGSSFSSDPPHATVQGPVVVFQRSWGGAPPQEDVTRWAKEEEARLRLYVSFQHSDLVTYNDGLLRQALDKIRQRKAHLLATQNLQAALPFKMHVRHDAPLTFAPDGVRKKPPPVKRPAQSTAQAFRPEPALSDQQFDDIIRTLRAMGRSMERNPAPYAKLGEEDLRSILLTALNAQFEGGATGETFSVTGKTDMQVQVDGRVVFIAECKIWDGPKTLEGAISQALGYLAWRDSHVSIVIFVRRKDFEAIAERIPTILAGHAQHLRSLPPPAAGEWRVRMRQTTDPDREVTLSLLAFHLPA